MKILGQRQSSIEFMDATRNTFSINKLINNQVNKAHQRLPPLTQLEIKLKK